MAGGVREIRRPRFLDDIMKVLNLYAGLGGNRKLWKGCEVTAVESDPEIAKAYRKFFPKDECLETDAHAYLESYYMNFDFIWSSPPCPSHSQYRFHVGHQAKGFAAVFPDMRLYEEIIFLQHHFKGRWVVENVKPYYKPLVEPSAILGRHYFWSNFPVDSAEFAPARIREKNKVADFSEFDITKTKIKNKRQALRNCVDPALGLHVFKAGIK